MKHDKSKYDYKNGRTTVDGTEPHFHLIKSENITEDTSNGEPHKHEIGTNGDIMPAGKDGHVHQYYMEDAGNEHPSSKGVY